MKTNKKYPFFVSRFVGWLVCHDFLKGGEFYFHAPIGALVPSVTHNTHVFTFANVFASAYIYECICVCVCVFVCASLLGPGRKQTN